MTNEDFIKVNEDILKLLDKKEAILLFTQKQAEQQQIECLKVEIEHLQVQLNNNEKQKEKLQGSMRSFSNAYNKLEVMQKALLDDAKQFCHKRDNMLASLPPSSRQKAVHQFKLLSQSQNDETKTFKPERISDSANLIEKLFYRKKLKEFDAQFANIQKDVEEGNVGNFDISLNLDKIADSINQKYDPQKKQLQALIAEKQKELTSIDKKNKNDKEILEAKGQALSQNTKVLESKVNHFSTVYDSNPFIDNSYIDPMVQKALNSGQFIGEEREKQVLISLLTTACRNSDIAKNVLYASLDKGTKFSIGKQVGNYTVGSYCRGVLSIDTDSMRNLDTDDKKVEAIAVLVHEARHSLQDSNENIVRNNWANTFMQSSLQEIDAYSIETAAVYQLNQNLGTNCYDYKAIDGDGHAYLLKAFTQEYEKSHDIVKSLNATALQWDEYFGYLYKTDRYIRNNWCHLQDNATTIHPSEIARRNNITYQGRPYLDIEKVTNQILTLDKSDYDEITKKLELSGKKDDSLQYFSVKIPELKKDEKGNVLQDKWGFNIIDDKIIPPVRKFVYSSESLHSNIDRNKFTFSDMKPQQKNTFIRTLRNGKNSFLETDRNSEVPTKEQFQKKSNVITPIKISREM